MIDTLGATWSAGGDAHHGMGERIRGPVLILALECARPGALSARHSLCDLEAVTIGRGRARTAERRGRALALSVPDRWMSSTHARIERSFARWMLCDVGSKNGVSVNHRRVQRAVLHDGDVIELGHTLFLFRAAVAVQPNAPRDLDLGAGEPSVPGLCTLDAELGDALDQLARVATSTLPILIQGQSGTGKEVLAKAVHRLSGRSGALVPVNCGAIAESLLESELFGSVRGAFSGAVADRQGLVRSAGGGTLFLDEIGDMPLASQAALLRVLQEREVIPVGGTRPIPVDLRVVAATHRELDELVASSRFRQDLLARLAGFRITLPPLADRREDLGSLIGLLLTRMLGGAPHPGLDIQAARCLFAYEWPLNVRELEQALRTAVVLAGNTAIDVEHLPALVRDARYGSQGGAPGTPGPSPESEPAGQHDPRSADPERHDRATVVAALACHRGNIKQAAAALGISRQALYRRIDKYGIERPARG